MFLVLESNYIDYTTTCEEYHCAKPVSPDHGFEIEPVNEYVLYDVVSFSCDDGFILGGSESVMCTGTGEWHPSIPKCYENCIIPYIVHGNADFAPGTSLHDQDQMNVSCDVTSYTLEGVDMVTCHDGTWNPPIGQCLSKCPSPIISDSDHSLNHGDVDHGEYVIVTCDAGYTFGLGSDYSYPLTCYNGTWDSSIECSANCELPSVCSSPPVYGGGTPTFSPASSCYPNGTFVHVTCSGVLFGQSECTCVESEYIDPPPTCEEYYCDKPVSPDHGFEIEPDNEYVLYDVVSFSCDDGFILGGSESVMCTGAGEWHPSIPKCYENCIIPYIAHGNADFAPGTSLHDQDQMNVSCDVTSYTIDGVDMVTCHDGTWNPPIGQCFSKCPSPIISDSDHSLNHGDVDHGEYVIVTCDAGYTFGLGSDYSYPLTCYNGTWDSSIQCSANCERPRFPDSMMITPGARVDQSHYHNDVITVKCAPNHVVVNGPPSASMSCDNGYWTPTMLPICKHINDT
eukprot:XP_011679167.1 PREDICTED: complement component receptor 1-like protein [Strongylocentrotus purpuratus]